MLWLSIGVFACICGAAWAAFLLLAARRRKLRQRETVHAAPVCSPSGNQLQEPVQASPNVDEASSQSSESSAEEEDAPLREKQGNADREDSKTDLPATMLEAKPSMEEMCGPLVESSPLVTEGDSRTSEPGHGDILPSVQPEESIEESRGRGDEVPRGEQLLGETHGSTSSEVVSHLSEPQPIAESEPSNTDHPEVIPFVEPSDSPSGEGSEQEHKKEEEVSLNQPADQEAEREIDETSPATLRAVSQGPASQVGHERGKAVDVAIEPAADTQEETLSPGTKCGEAEALGEEISTGNEELDELQESSDTVLEQAVLEKIKRPKKEPRKYAGLARKPPEREDTGRRASRAVREDTEKRDRSLPIEVRLLFDRGGFCTVSLIARRSPGMPEDLTVADQSGEIDLRGMQDDWYQDVVPGDISHVLREGRVWTWEDETGQYRWSLSGRELFVLAARTDVRGYISQPCLELGREHMVLCTDDVRGNVEEAIRACGAAPREALNSSFGVPTGWVVFKNIIPTNPAAPVSEADILNALRPLPKIEIALEAGIRLEYTTWLEGYPPLIRVYGDTEHTAEVFIDGYIARRYAEDGAYRVSGWDSVGLHSVWCGGTRKSYTVVPFTASWEAWDAYTFAIAFRSDQSMSICGPVVCAKSGESQVMAPSFLVPESNPVVLGATPGQYLVATKASAVRGLPCIVSPSFQPIWALPRDPLHCHKKTVRIILMREALPSESDGPVQKCTRRMVNDDVLAWCRIILGASRKGLQTEPDNENVWKIWLSYKRLALQIWRARK
jgi:hypothetical protein